MTESALLALRNKIFTESGIPGLYNLGFSKSPFSTAWFGRNNLGDYTYELCRLRDNAVLEIVVTHISKGDRWIKVF